MFGALRTQQVVLPPRRGPSKSRLERTIDYLERSFAALRSPQLAGRPPGPGTMPGWSHSGASCAAPVPRWRTLERGAPRAALAARSASRASRLRSCPGLRTPFPLT